MGRVKKKPVLALLCIVLSILTIVAMMPGMAYADIGKSVKQSKKSEKTESHSQGNISRHENHLDFSGNSTSAEDNQFDVVLDSDLSEINYDNASGYTENVAEKDQTENKSVGTAYPGKSFTLQEKIDCSTFDFWSINQTLLWYLEEKTQNYQGDISPSVSGNLTITLTVPDSITLDTKKVSANNKGITVNKDGIKCNEKDHTREYTIPVLIRGIGNIYEQYKRIGCISLNFPLSMSDNSDYGKMSTVSSRLEGELFCNFSGNTFNYNVTDRQSKDGFYGDSQDYITDLDEKYTHRLQDKFTPKNGHYYAAYISDMMQQEMIEAKILNNVLEKNPQLLTKTARDKAKNEPYTFYNMLYQVKGLIRDFRPTFKDGWDDNTNKKFNELSTSEDLENYVQEIVERNEVYPGYIQVPRQLSDGTDCKADLNDTTTRLTVSTPYKVTVHPNVTGKDYSGVVYVKPGAGISKNRIQSYESSYEGYMPGYRFQYWTTTKDGKNDFFDGKDTQPITKNIDLYAIWGKNTETPVINGPDHGDAFEGVTENNYSFNTGDGSPIEIEKVESKSSLEGKCSIEKESPKEYRLKFENGIDAGTYKVTLKATNDAGTTTKVFTYTVHPICLDADLQLTEINGKQVTDDPSETDAVKTVSPGDQVTCSMVIDGKILHVIDNDLLLGWFDGSSGPDKKDEIIEAFSRSLSVELEIPDYIKVDPEKITLNEETSKHWDIEEVKSASENGHTLITLTLSNKKHIPAEALMNLVSDNDNSFANANFEKSLMDILSNADESEIRVNFDADINKTAPASRNLTIKGNLKTNMYPSDPRINFSAKQSKGGLYTSDPVCLYIFSGGGPGHSGYQETLKNLLNKNGNNDLFGTIELSSEDNKYILDKYLKGWTIDQNEDGTYKEVEVKFGDKSEMLYQYHRILPDGTDAVLKNVQDQPTEPQLTLQTTPTTPTEPTTPTTPTTPTEPTTPTTPTTPTEPSKPEEHTITFQPNNGQPTFTQTVPDGGEAVLPDEPSKKGHKFIGWYTDSALTKAYDFSTPVKSDLTLYAKWKKGKPTPKPAKKKVTGILLPKVIAKGKHTQVLTWTALKNVDGYFIYTNHCDEGRLLHPFKKVADYKASKARVYTKKHLTTYDNYKYYVAAYKIKHGKKVIVRNSVTVHSVCGNTSARSTNVKAVKASRHAVTLKKGKTYRIKASAYKVNKKRAFLDQTHCGLLRYLTADSKVATVDYNTGKVKAVKAGKTNVYILGVNGIRDKVTVTVK